MRFHELFVISTDFMRVRDFQDFNVILLRFQYFNGISMRFYDFNENSIS